MPIVENYGKLAKANRSFDIKFWQEQGPEAIFIAAMQLIQDSILLKGNDANESGIQRTAESFKKISG
ncbi:hypothetical protein IT568_07870 [bacterium]|nr:hypothetical protein [bacterium]